MSHEPPKGPQVTTTSSGSPLKWLAGAAVVAVLAGGGYFAWKNMSPASPATSSSQLAYNETTDSTLHAGPLPPDQSAESITPAESAPAPAADAPTAHRRHAARPVPQEVVGVVLSGTSASIPQDDAPIIVHPMWTRKPSSDLLSAAYPSWALERGREGEASVHCRIGNSGALHCVPVSEAPAHAGFGAAAMRVARMYRHGPALADGSPAAGSPVNIRVVFRMAENERRS